MQTFENLYSRRSVRSYTGEGPGEAQLAEILKSAYAAPVGKAQYQSLHLTVIENKDYLSRWEAAVGEATGNPDAHPFYGAPVVMVVLANKGRGTIVYDGSLVMGNLMLAAHELGIGSCWIHRAKEVFEQPEWKEWLASLGIEGDYEGIGNCVLGYVDGEYPDILARKEGRTLLVE
jgi:nitroreductase